MRFNLIHVVNVTCYLILLIIQNKKKPSFISSLVTITMFALFYC